MTPAEKPVKRLFHLKRVYNNPPDRITNQNMDLQSIPSESKNTMGLAWCLFKCICIILGAADAKLEKGICLLIFYPRRGN